MKRLTILAFSLLLAIPSVAFGAPGDRLKQADPTKLQNLGASMVDKRVTAITKYDSALAKTKYISEPTLNAVRGELSRIKNELTSLKEKIMNETDMPTLRADVKSIATNYRVYQVFLPQSAGIVAVDRMKAYSAKLDEISTKIEAKTNELEGQGKDVSEVRSLLSSATASIASGKTSTDAALEKFNAMSISDAEGARTLRIDGRSSLQTARTNLSSARVSLRDAAQKLKQLVGTTTQ
jgi:predicted  nucleic acid-binding Zn-ribbon protein